MPTQIAMKTHPLEHLVLKAFKTEEMLRPQEMAPYLAGSAFIARDGGYKAYRIVAEDAMECLHHQGKLDRDDAGFYYLPGRKPPKSPGP